MGDLLLLMLLTTSLLLCGMVYFISRYIQNLSKLWCVQPMSVIGLTLSYIFGAMTASEFWPLFWNQLSGPPQATSQLFVVLVAPAVLLGTTVAFYRSLTVTPGIRETMACLLAFVFSHTVWLQTHSQQLGLSFDEAIGCIAAFPVFAVAVIALASTRPLLRRPEVEILSHPAFKDEADSSA